ncbi:hypothetical protein DMQ72_00015 [Klebsiella quasipneumoniae]|nr:hypothetical protein DP204_07675 [Klebsiella quasipneumoniae subsp. quasipneumoniae]PXI00135.1 hypothetical protein DMQ72_00015 [Klebsiella quasipneumoniae]RNT43740.1 hypothetical protein B9473_015360 [Klebsiella quasipneumoniae subsp. quasipneumoniae]
MTALQKFNSINRKITSFEILFFFIFPQTIPKWFPIYIPPKRHLSLQTTIITEVFIRKYRFWPWRL